MSAEGGPPALRFGVRLSALRAEARAWWAAARANALFRLGMAGAALVLALDQASKFWIVEGLRLPERPRGQIEISAIFDLSYVQNYGASFGMLAGGGVWRVLLTAISVAVATWLALWLGRLDRKVAAAGVALIIGGALGNLVDRLRLGYVIDFLDFSGLHFPWVFNVADAAINVGVAFLILDAVLSGRKTEVGGGK